MIRVYFVFSVPCQNRDFNNLGWNSFWMGDDGIMMFGQHMFVPNNKDLKLKLLREAHESKFTVQPGSTKMYQDLK